ncbi:MAG TPA: TolC family protein [Gemmatimonadaceae bacterium]|nr:TolC family protein [Gemmatimonadaceae bacterium]
MTSPISLIARGALRVAAVLAFATRLGAQAPAAAPDSALPITVDEAIRLARQNVPAAVQARGTERTNRAAVRSAYGSLLPSLSVSLGAIRQLPSGATTRLNPTTGVRETLPNQPWTYSNGLSANMTLFNGGQSLYDIRTARANVESGEATSVAQEFAVALDVSQQYYNALAARESEAAARVQLQLAEQQLRYSATRVRAGVATKSDSLRSLIQVGTAQLALLTGQTNLRSANAALTRLVGSPRAVTAAPEDTLLPPLDSAALDTTALGALAMRGPAVRQAEAAYDAARTTRRAARAPYLPSVTASYSRAGSGQARFGFGEDPYTYGGSFALRLSYPLFDQFSREERVVRADVAEDNASAALRDARLAARQLLVQNVDLLRTAQERARVQQISVLAAEEDLRVQQQRYNAGASTLLDVLTSQTQLAQAQTALIQARFDARVARARLESLIGQRLTPAAR